MSSKESKFLTENPLPPGAILVTPDKSPDYQKKQLRQALEFGRQLCMILTPNNKKIVSRVLEPLKEDLRLLG